MKIPSKFIVSFENEHCNTTIDKGCANLYMANKATYFCELFNKKLEMNYKNSIPVLKRCSLCLESFKED